MLTSVGTGLGGCGAGIISPRVPSAFFFLTKTALGLESSLQRRIAESALITSYNFDYLSLPGAFIAAYKAVIYFYFISSLVRSYSPFPSVIPMSAAAARLLSTFSDDPYVSGFCEDSIFKILFK